MKSNVNLSINRSHDNCSNARLLRVGSVVSYSRFVHFLAILLPPLDNKALSVGAFRIKQRLQSHWTAWACQSFPSCSRTASVTWGWQCPRFVTPMPGSSVIDEGCQMTGTVHSTCRASRFQVHNLYFHKQFFRYLPLHLLMTRKKQALKNPVARSCWEVQILLAIYGENPAALSSFQHLRS